MTVNREKRHLILGWGLMECLFFSGIVFGWPGFLQHILLHNEFFLKLCENGTISENGSTVVNVYGVFNVLPRKVSEFDLEKSDQNFGSANIVYTPNNDNSVRNLTIDSNEGTSGERLSFYNGPRSQRLRREAEMETYYYDEEDLSMFRKIWSNFTCPRQEAELQRVYVVSLFVANFLCIFGGMMFDFLGTLKTRMLIIALHTAATVLMAFNGPDMSWLLYPGLGLTSFGGLLIFLTNVQISNLYGSLRYMVVGLFVGAFDSSRIVMFFIAINSHEIMNVQMSFMFITVSIIPFLIGTIALLPKGRIPWPLPEDYGRRRASATNGYLMRANRGSQKRQKRQYKAKFSEIIRTPLYISQVIWFSVLYLRSSFFASSIKLQLAFVFKQEMTIVESYLQVFNIIQCFGILIGPFVGVVVDRQTKAFTGLARTQQALCNLSLVHVIVILLSIAQCIISMIPATKLFYTTFVLEVLCRAALMTVHTILLLVAFPMEYFGKLFGLCQFITMFFQLSQSIFAIIIRDHLAGDAFYIHALLLTLTCLVSIHPYFIIGYKKVKAAEGVSVTSATSFEGAEDHQLCETTADDPQMEVRVRILEDPLERKRVQMIV
ncbi:equilibrative nucleobase transporter 1-like isoform X2 [Lineus longissimus]|uniref:equilibrative nucleobase transporter 1-like isoform X2 n=1 Tax=Lineus longissimus TaxID=88925 RepID=UPI00315DCB26